MKNLFTLVLLLSCFSVYGKDQDAKLTCKQFRTGKYIMKDSVSGTTIINRNDSLQTETVNDGKIVIELRVKWVNDCTYILSYSRALKDPDNETKDWPKNMIITVTITDIAADSYMQTSTSNLFPETLTERIWRMK